MKQYDIYITKGFIPTIHPMTDDGERVYNELGWKCLEAGMTIQELTIVDIPRIIGGMRRAGYSVTQDRRNYDQYLQSLPALTDDELLQELEVSA